MSIIKQHVPITVQAGHLAKLLGYAEKTNIFSSPIVICGVASIEHVVAPLRLRLSSSCLVFKRSPDLLLSSSVHDQIIGELSDDAITLQQFQEKMFATEWQEFKDKGHFPLMQHYFTNGRIGSEDVARIFHRVPEMQQLCERNLFTVLDKQQAAEFDLSMRLYAANHGMFSFFHKDGLAGGVLAVHLCHGGLSSDSQLQLVNLVVVLEEFQQLDAEEAFLRRMGINSDTYRPHDPDVAAKWLHDWEVALVELRIKYRAFYLISEQMVVLPANCYHAFYKVLLNLAMVKQRRPEWLRADGNLDNTRCFSYKELSTFEYRNTAAQQNALGALHTLATPTPLEGYAFDMPGGMLIGTKAYATSSITSMVASRDRVISHGDVSMLAPRHYLVSLFAGAATFRLQLMSKGKLTVREANGSFGTTNQLLNHACNIYWDCIMEQLGHFLAHIDTSREQKLASSTLAATVWECCVHACRAELPYLAYVSTQQPRIHPSTELHIRKRQVEQLATQSQSKRKRAVHCDLLSHCETEVRDAADAGEDCLVHYLFCETHAPSVQHRCQLLRTDLATLHRDYMALAKPGTMRPMRDAVTVGFRNLLGPDAC